MKIQTNFEGHPQHYYISDNDFMLNYTPYEHDELTDRYYFLEPSISMTSKAGREGGLVRRRISKANYETALGECRTRLSVFEDNGEQTHEGLYRNTAADVLRYRADRLEDKVLTLGAFVPQVSGKDMVTDFEQELRQQIKSRHYPIANPSTAAHELYGYRTALEQLGIIGTAECLVTPYHFEQGVSPLDTFSNLPPEKQGGTARQVYALGRAFAQDCPKNDCSTYLNIFNMCRETDEQIDRLTGWPRRALEMELVMRYIELERMFFLNHAVKLYKRKMEQQVNRKEPPTVRRPPEFINITVEVDQEDKKEPPDEQTAPYEVDLDKVGKLIQEINDYVSENSPGHIFQ